MLGFQRTGLRLKFKMHKYKIALISICLNKPYHQYIGPMFDSARKFFLKGHEVDYFVWSEMDKLEGATVIPTEPHAWPTPTLFRYALFLQQEDKLKEYDYIFYCDADMLFVSRVGDEILGDGLTAAQHPMYAIRHEYIPPYEPNKLSTSYIPRPGRVIELNGKKRLETLYFAGGLQGGRAEDFIKAMKVMKEKIEEDFIKINYIPIWNDESQWNKYLLDNPPSVVLNPSYIMPDSLNKAYYQRLWGRNYVPKLVTLTKPFSLTKEGGQNLQQILQ